MVSSAIMRPARVRCAQLRAPPCGRCRATACGGDEGGRVGDRGESGRGEGRMQAGASGAVPAMAREGTRGGGRDARARARDSLITCHSGHMNQLVTWQTVGRRAVRVRAPKFLCLQVLFQQHIEIELQDFHWCESICYFVTCDQFVSYTNCRVGISLVQTNRSIS